MLTPRVGLVVVTSPLEVGADQAPRILDEAKSMLQAVGLEVPVGSILSDEADAAHQASSLAGVDSICVVAATWAEDYLVQGLLSRLDRPTPIVTWALPGLHTGSLCGTHQLCYILNEIGCQYCFVYGELADAASRVRARDYIMAAAAMRALQGARFGQIGGPTKGMSDVEADESALFDIFGSRVIKHDLQWLAKRAASMDEESAQSVWRAACDRAGSSDVSDAAGIESAMYYLALREFTQEESLIGITAECYPALMGKVCLPFALLAELDDVVGACEGDVNGAVAMRLMAWLTGKPVHNTDLLSENRQANAMVFSHCGSSALCLAESEQAVCFRSCRLMDVGVTGQFPGRRGRVTMINLVNHGGGYVIGLATGECTGEDSEFPGNPVTVRFDVPVIALIHDIPEMGLGHHWMIGEGDVAQAVRDFGRLARVPVMEPGAGPRHSPFPS